MNSLAGSSSFVAVGSPREKPTPMGYSTQSMFVRLTQEYGLMVGEY
jgi:hypothetical protein